MTAIRFTLVGLLVAVTLVGLSMAALGSLREDASSWQVATGGLSLCTLLFAIVCRSMEQSELRVLLSSVVFYAWGFGCLFLCDAISLSDSARGLLVAAGVGYSSWTWFGPHDALAAAHREY